MLSLDMFLVLLRAVDFGYGVRRIKKEHLGLSENKTLFVHRGEALAECWAEGLMRMVQELKKEMEA